MISCKTCPWFEVGHNPTGVTNEKLGKEGFCLYNPPIGAAIPTPGLNIARTGPSPPQIAHIGLIPTTFESRRCHKHPMNMEVPHALP